jgi:hypothetical protein
MDMIPIALRKRTWHRRKLQLLANQYPSAIDKGLTFLNRESICPGVSIVPDLGQLIQFLPHCMQCNQE